MVMQPNPPFPSAPPTPPPSSFPPQPDPPPSNFHPEQFAPPIITEPIMEEPVFAAPNSAPPVVSDPPSAPPQSAPPVIPDPPSAPPAVPPPTTESLPPAPMATPVAPTNPAPDTDGWRDEMMEEEIEDSFSSARELLEYMDPKIEYSWEKYIDYIHQSILICGATALVLITSLFGSDVVAQWDHRWMGAVALTLAIGGMISGLAWRITSQFFMDREVFGDKDLIIRYFKIMKIRSVTDYENLYYNEDSYNSYRRIFSASSTFTMLLVVASWIVSTIFLFMNL